MVKPMKITNEGLLSMSNEGFIPVNRSLITSHRSIADRGVLNMTQAIFIISLLLLLQACGSDGGDSGALSFSVKMHGQAVSTGESFDCTLYGIDNVTAEIKDASGATLATGGPWACSARSGSLENIPVGENYTLVIYMKNASGKILYTVEKTGIKIEGGVTNDAGVLIVSPPKTGDLDVSFGDGGKVRTSMGFANAEMNASAIQSDGKIVAGGTCLKGQKKLFALARYNTDGSLDQAFGEKGIVMTDLNLAGINSLAIQKDGKIIAGGSFWDNSAGKFKWAIARYNPDGTLDAGFGSNKTGIVITSILGDDGAIYSLAVQNDGKILAGGCIHLMSSNISVFTLVRYNPDGSLDNTDFGAPNGYVAFPVGTSDACINSIALDPSGRIVAGGYSFGNSSFLHNVFTVARFSSNGDIDSSFASNIGITGVVATDIGLYRSVIQSLAIDNSGRIVAGGFVSTGVNNIMAFATYNTSGGAAEISGTMLDDKGYSEIRSINILPDNKIICTGFSGGEFTPQATIVKKNADMTQDESFGINGITILEDGFVHRAISSQVLGDGSIVAIGVCATSSAFNRHMSLVSKFTPAGSVDTGFGNNGSARTPMGYADAEVKSLIIQPDGKLVAAGFTTNGSGPGIALARYNTDGSPDSSFGNSGTVITPVPNIYYKAYSAYSAVLMPDGKIITGGYYFTEDNMEEYFLFAEYGPDGSINEDTDMLIVPNPPNYSHAKFRSMAYQNQSGGIIAVGDAYSTTQNSDDFMLIRYLESGVLDTSFGSNGYSMLQIEPFTSVTANAAAIVPADGKIIAAGMLYLSNTSRWVFLVAKFNADGTGLDTSFGSPDGYVLTQIGDEVHSEINAIAITQDSIIAAGNTGIEYTEMYKIAVAKYNLATGALDPDFGDNASGIKTIEIPGYEAASCYAIDVNPSDGKIYLAGWVRNTDQEHSMIVARLTADGSLDSTFASGTGYLIIKMDVDTGAFAMSMQPDGKIVAAGGVGLVVNDAIDFSLVRLWP